MNEYLDISCFHWYLLYGYHQVTQSHTTILQPGINLTFWGWLHNNIKLLRKILKDHLLKMKTRKGKLNFFYKYTWTTRKIYLSMIGDREGGGGKICPPLQSIKRNCKAAKKSSDYQILTLSHSINNWKIIQTGSSFTLKTAFFWQFL